MQARGPVVTRGFTLIELMIGLVVLVIVIAIGLPGMQGLINSGRLSAATNELSAAVQLTRVEALRRNRSVVLCRSATLAACAAGDTWPGWLVFVDANNNGAVDTGEEIIKTGMIDAPVVVRASDAISGRNDIVAFLPNGLARGADEAALLNATLMVCVPTDPPTANVRDVQLAFGSRVGVVSRQTAGDCSSAPSDS